MENFKVGDIVKYVSGNCGESRDNPLWGGCHGNIKGRIIWCSHRTDRVNVAWDNGYQNYYEEKDLSLFEYKPYEKIKVV